MKDCAGQEVNNGRGGGKDVIAVAASPAAATATTAAATTAAAAVAVVADCLSIGALFSQWVVQKCCSISMHNAADTFERQQRGWLLQFLTANGRKLLGPSPITRDTATCNLQLAT